MDEATTTTLAVIDTDQVSIIIAEAPQSLTINKTSMERANKAGQALLDTISGGGMDDALDAACNSYLVRVRKTIDEMYERRVNVTQIMDMIRKEFTALENALSPKNAESCYAKIQVLRDKYAADKIKIQREKEQQALRKLELDKELIRLKSEVQLQLAGYFNSLLSNKLQQLTGIYNTITLDAYDVVKKGIADFPESYSHDHFDSFTPSIRAIYASTVQVNELKIEAAKGKFGEFADAYRVKISESKQSLLDKLPSRKQELEEIAAAEKKNKDHAAEMKRQAEERAKLEQERLAREEQERQSKSEAEISSKAAAASTQSLFDAQVTISEAPKQAAPIRESYGIEVLNPLGYMLITQFYFEKEGKTEDVGKLEKKTLGAMKTFCEKWAMKHDEKIDSAFLKYNEKFKTIAKK